MRLFRILVTSIVGLPSVMTAIDGDASAVFFDTRQPQKVIEDSGRAIGAVRQATVWGTP
jgi:hypothetical protein